jgi:hypothetical protein
MTFVKSIGVSLSQIKEEAWINDMTSVNYFSSFMCYITQREIV